MDIRYDTYLYFNFDQSNPFTPTNLLLVHPQNHNTQFDIHLKCDYQ